MARSGMSRGQGFLNGHYIDRRVLVPVAEAVFWTSEDAVNLDGLLQSLSLVAPLVDHSQLSPAPAAAL